MIEALAPLLIGLLMLAAMLAFAALSPRHRAEYVGLVLGGLALAFSLLTLAGVPIGYADGALTAVGVIALALPVIDLALSKRRRSRPEEGETND
jgi:hypothetical protein